MQKLFVSQILAEVEALHEMLGHQGIPCLIKNQQGSSLAGEVPFAEVFPELWVVNNEDFSRAQEFVEDWKVSQPTECSDWTCSGCGETHTREFTTCWKCEAERVTS